MSTNGLGQAPVRARLSSTNGLQPFSGVFFGIKHRQLVADGDLSFVSYQSTDRPSRIKWTGYRKLPGDAREQES